MLVAVVLLFVICWSPYLIDNVLMSFDVLPAARTGRIKHMRIAFHLLSYVNSCINPFVYGFMSRNFRRGFEVALRLRSPGHFTLCCCCCFKTNCCDNIRSTLSLCLFLFFLFFFYLASVEYGSKK